MTITLLQETLSQLPDYGESEDYLPLFREICTYNCKTAEERLQLAYILNDLSLRQWEAGEYLEASVRTKLDELIPTIWDQEDLSSTRHLLTVTHSLALKGTWDYMQTRAGSISNPEVKTELLGAIEEYGRSTLDPWRDYEWSCRLENCPPTPEAWTQGLPRGNSRVKDNK